MVLTSRVPVRIDLAGAWTDVPEFALSAGGAVVNATIDRYVTGRLDVSDDPQEGEPGIRVSYESVLPSGSGLGTSAAMNVCWLSLVNGQHALDLHKRQEMAEAAFQLESLLGILGGKQDQYAAAFGGFNFLRFDEDVQAQRLPMDAEFVSELERRLILCYTGKPRLSSDIHQNVWAAFRRGEARTVKALHSLREGAYAMKEALLSNDLDAVARLIGESWSNQKALDDLVTNDSIETLFTAAKSEGARSGKACGAGGGGCVLFVTEPQSRSEVVRTLESHGAREVSFRFEFEGLKVSKHA